MSAASKSAGLSRRPRVGETLLAGNGKRWVVVGFWDRNDDVAVIRHEDGSGETQFIWRFRDGLNNYFSHVDTKAGGR